MQASSVHRQPFTPDTPHENPCDFVGFATPAELSDRAAGCPAGCFHVGNTPLHIADSRNHLHFQAHGAAEVGPRGRYGVAQSVKTWLRVLAPMLVSMGGLVALRLLGPDFVDQQRLASWLEPFGKWAPIAYIGFLAIRPVTLLPGQLLTAVGGMMFGTLAATLYSLTGGLLSGLLLFAAARKLGTGLMKRLAGSKYPALVRAARRHDFLFAFTACINPLCPTDVMLAAAAASGARLMPTLAGILIGTLPGTYLTAQLGSGLAQGRTTMTAVAAGGLVVSLVLGGYIGRRFYKEINEEAPKPRAEPPPPARRPIGHSEATAKPAAF